MRYRGYFDITRRAGDSVILITDLARNEVFDPPGSFEEAKKKIDAEIEHRESTRYKPGYPGAAEYPNEPDRYPPKTSEE